MDVFLQIASGKHITLRHECIMAETLGSLYDNLSIVKLK